MDSLGDGDPPNEIPDATSLDLSYDEIADGAVIGQGGNADVFRVTVQRGGREVPVAVKQPRLQGTLDTDTVDQFVQEADVWAELDGHDHIVSLYDWGAEPLPWLAMEYMDRGTLADVPDGERLPLEQALWVGVCVSRAVHHAHRFGVAHHDIKPANVLFTSSGDGWAVPKVSDWGLARLMLDKTGSVAEFSPQYAAPEQFDAEQYGSPDDRTDIYQVGTLVYELVTGRPPFEGSATAVMQGVLSTEPAPPSEVADVPAELDDILGTALAKEPDERYESILYLRDRLQSAFDSLQEGRSPADSQSSAPPASADTQSTVGEPSETETRTADRRTEAETGQQTNTDTASSIPPEREQNPAGMAPGPTGQSHDAAGGQQAGSDTTSRLPNLRVGAVALAVLGLVAFAFVAGPFMSGSTSAGQDADLDLELASAEVHGADGVLVEGSLDGVEANGSNPAFSVEILNGESPDAAPLVTAEDVPPTEFSDGQFSLRVDPERIETQTEAFEYDSDTTYEVVVTVPTENITDSTTVEQGELQLDLTGANWTKADGAVALSVEGELLQGGAPMYGDTPDIAVTLDQGEQLVPDTVDYQQDDGTFSLIVGDDGRDMDLTEASDFSITATYGDAEDTMEFDEPAPEPSARLSGLNIAGQTDDATITKGDSVDVSVSVANVAGRAGTFEVQLTVGDRTDSKQTEELEIGDSTEVEFEDVAEGLNPGAYDVAVSTDNKEVSGTLTVEEQPEAEAELSNLDIGTQDTDATTTVGDPVDITVDVTNVGDKAGTFDTTLSIDGDPHQTGTSEEIGPNGGTATVTFEEEFGDLDPGSYEIGISVGDAEVSGSLTAEQPPTLELSNLDIAGQGEEATVDAGNFVDFFVDATNVGDKSGTFEIFIAFDAQTAGTKTVELGPGETKTVDFGGTNTLPPGQTDVTVSNSPNADKFVQVVGAVFVEE